MNIAQIKDAMSCFTTGVTVVTTKYGGEDYGMTCNSFNTVSLDPPMVMWCIRKNSHSHAAFTRGAGYVVNVLAASQESTAMKFSVGTHSERFSSVACEATLSGRQRLKGAIAWFDCALEQTVGAGDHDILIGRVLAVGIHDAPGLIYARRQFGVMVANALNTSTSA